MRHIASRSLALSLLLATACGGAESASAGSSDTATSGQEQAAAVEPLECALGDAGAVAVAAPAGAVLRSNETGCVVFLGEGSDPATADFVAQWGAVPSDAETAESFVRRRGMLGDFEVIEQSEASFLGAPAQVSHVNAPSPPGIGDPREAWIVWAPRGEVNVMAIALCRPGDASCAASVRAMIAGSE